MDAADALTVIPRSRSTLRVSRRAISSLVSLVVGLVGVAVADGYVDDADAEDTEGTDSDTVDE